MLLPKVESLPVVNGVTVITQDQYYALQEEASINAAETGADREYDFILEEHEWEFISNYLGSNDWILLEIN